MFVVDAGEEYRDMRDGLWVIFDPALGWIPDPDPPNFTAWHEKRRAMRQSDGEKEDKS